MFTEYVQAAMKKATYEIMENGEFFGEIPGFPGVLGSAPSLEATREDLQSALEGWLLLKLWDHDRDIPRLGRLSLYPTKPRLNASSSRDTAIESTVSSRDRKAS
jgi:predicted RNase H-like HicB family nuclease